MYNTADLGVSIKHTEVTFIPKLKAYNVGTFPYGYADKKLVTKGENCQEASFT